MFFAKAFEVYDLHSYDHKHANVSSGALRACIFGAMDGLVSNIGLIAGIASASTEPVLILLAGISGLLSGAFSMGMGEYISVKGANEQVQKELMVEKASHIRNAKAEEMELAHNLENMGMSSKTASQAALEIHQNNKEAVNIHIIQELGVSPDNKPSPYLAGIFSFIFFSIGAVVPVIPYFFGIGSLFISLVFGGIGLIITGSLVAFLTKKNIVFGGLRQLVFGFVAIIVTYLIGLLIGNISS